MFEDYQHKSVVDDDKEMAAHFRTFPSRFFHYSFFSEQTNILGWSLQGIQACSSTYHMKYHQLYITNKIAIHLNK